MDADSAFGETEVPGWAVCDSLFDDERERPWDLHTVGPGSEVGNPFR